MSSSTSSTLTSVLTALGGSSGIDVTDAVDSILYADRAPERIWTSEQATLSDQTTALNLLDADALTLSTDLTALDSSTGVLGTVSATSSDSSVVTATAATGTVAGTHSVIVNSLATTDSWYSSEVASSSTTLTADDSISITANGTTKTVSAAGQTLTQLEATINSGSYGVTASVVTDSSGARLTLTSNTSGAAGAISLSSTDLTFTNSVVGANGNITVDGVPIKPSSNTVTGAIEGVTLTLTGTSPTTTSGGVTSGIASTLTLSPNTDAITSAVQAFVSAYNTMITDVNTQFSYNTATDTAGPLQSDSLIQGLQSALLGSTSYSSGDSTYGTLTQLGITVGSTGTLTLDSTTLTSAISADSSAVSTFFQGTDSNGFAASLMSTLYTYTDSTGGAFTVDLASIKSENTDLQNQINTLETYLASQQTILTTKYNEADAEIQDLPEELKQTNALLNPNEYSSSNS